MIYILPVLGVLLSFLFVVIAKPTKNEYFKLLLAFSGAFLLALTIFEMLPEVYTDTDARDDWRFCNDGDFIPNIPRVLFERC